MFQKPASALSRCRKQAAAAFAEREANRDAEWQAEQETGTQGVFALLNKRLGDESEAAKILRKADARHAEGFLTNGSARFDSGKTATAAPADSRRALVAGQVGTLSILCDYHSQ